MAKLWILMCFIILSMFPRALELPVPEIQTAKLKEPAKVEVGNVSGTIKDWKCFLNGQSTTNFAKEQNIDIALRRDGTNGFEQISVNISEVTEAFRGAILTCRVQRLQGEDLEFRIIFNVTDGVECLENCTNRPTPDDQNGTSCDKDSWIVSEPPTRTCQGLKWDPLLNRSTSCVDPGSDIGTPVTNADTSQLHVGITVGTTLGVLFLGLLSLAVYICYHYRKRRFKKMEARTPEEVKARTPDEVEERIPEEAKARTPAEVEECIPEAEARVPVKVEKCTPEKDLVEEYTLQSAVHQSSDAATNLEKLVEGSELTGFRKSLSFPTHQFGRDDNELHYTDTNPVSLNPDCQRAFNRCMEEESNMVGGPSFDKTSKTGCEAITVELETNCDVGESDC